MYQSLKLFSLYSAFQKSKSSLDTSFLKATLGLEYFICQVIL